MKSRRYNKGIIRQLATGKWQADFARDGKRERRNFDTEAECCGWLDGKADLWQRHTRPPSPHEIADIHRVREVLGPGVSLSDVVAFWQRHHKSNVEAPKPKEAVEKFLEEKRASGIRGRYEEQLRIDLHKLLDLWPAANLADYSTERLQDVLTSMKVKPRTRDGYRRVWGVFFAWCLKRRWIIDNPALGVTSGKFDDLNPEIFSHQQVKDLIEKAKKAKSDILPVLAVGFYAGLRTSEIEALDWSAFQGDFIRVLPEVSKMRRQRLVPILPPLRAVVRLYGHKSGPVAPGSKNVIHARVRGLCDVWPHNVMRHTWISHRLAQVQNIAQVALEAGNSPDIIFRHYRELVTPAAGAAYFAVTKQ